MGDTGQVIIFPTREDIVRLNRYHIESTGGTYSGGDNLRSSGSLEWVLDAIQYPLFGIDRYPTVVEKAAKLSWIISAGHIFHDGNKRTGTSVLMIFLQTNGYRLKATHEEIINIIIRISSPDKAKYPYEDYVEWIRSKIVLVNK
ncbi:MAG: type II toxin-antitoxin system death-on-curing family toxin [Chloroflexi bacterium]|nr:type II toxin-antitoxin system death-on-curing family toxin [Chloroflexota bacterium]